MTEDSMGSGRPRKNTRKSNGNSSSCPRSTNGITDIPEAQVIVEPLSTAMSDIMNEESSDAATYSPAKAEESSEICALCNCGQEMALILGEITKYPVASSTLKKIKEKMKTEMDRNINSEVSSSDNQKNIKEKSFVKRRRRKKDNDFDLTLPPDMTTFGTANVQDFNDIIDSKGKNLFAHHCCAAWSAGVSQNDSCDLENVDKAVAKALTKKCSHCDRYGASVECQVHRCTKIYHYACCASTGAFQDINSMNLLCPGHLDRTEKLTNADPSCDACGKTDNLDLQLFCTSCGHHFHSYCVDMHIPITPVVRMGWQCSYCKLCQGCKQPGDEDRMLCCDNCDKGFHTYCLNPPITSVPKSAWKCISCRKCEDCGSTRPGGGPSCKWHNNFSLCDRCYQQRKKGQCCPVCNRAVRLCSSSILMQCSQCFKCVHRDCDPDGIEDNYICVECVKNENHAMMEDVEMEDMMNNETNDSYDYDLLASGQKKLTLEEAELFSMAASQDFIESCQANNNNSPHLQNNLPQDDLEQFESEKYSESTVDSPYSSVMSESLAEPSNSNFFPMVNRKGPTKSRRLHKPGRGKKRNRNGSIESVTQFEKEKPIVIQIDELPDSTSNLTASSSTKEAPESISILSEEGEEEDEDDFEETEEDNEDGLHSTVLIVSNKDEFTLKQDVCMCCGSFGKGREGYLIGCVQCGQCFHPYCVNVKVNEVILSRGWRCIDCTVCEGCGLNADEAHLLLCDICDVSFHTYCLQPPLEEVPVGGWKCQWCAVCEDCGVKEPGYGCSWMGNYSQCGQCSSEQYCSICSYPYEPNNLVIQCEKCDRWAHAECDGLNSESDAKLACTMTYHCVHCRPKTKHLGIYSSLKSSVITKVSIRKALNSNDKNEKPKKTKTLKDVKLDKMAKAALREQKRAAEDALPLVPQNAVRDDSGVVDIDLNMMRSKLRCDDTLKERLHLTENGLKQIKSLVIRAPHIRSTRARRRKEEKNLFVATLTEESNQASIADESNQAIIENQDEQSVDKPDMPLAPPSETLPEPIEGSQDLLDGAIPSSEPLLGTAEPDIMSPEQVKQEDDMEMIAPDTTAETDELLLDDYDIDPEDATDPFEFFGVNLLERHLHLELEYIQEGKKKRPKKEKKEKRRKRDAKLMASFFTGPSVPDPTDLSLSLPPAPPEEPVVPSSEPPMQLEDGQEPLPMDPNQSADSEILQEPGTEEVMLPTESPAPESALIDTDIPMETDSFDVEMPVQGQSSMEVDFHDSAPQSVDMSTVNTQLPTGGEGLNPITSTDITPSSLNVSTPDSHLISTSVVPTSSLSVDVSQPSVDLLAKQHPLEIKVDNSPTITSKMITPPIDMISSAEHLPHVDGHEMAQYLAGIELETALPPGAPTSVPGSIPGGNPLDMFPPTQQQRPMGGPHSHHHLLQAAFDPIHTHPQQQLMQMKSPPIMSPTGMDPFKLGPFAEESRAGGQQSAPIDAQTQKQLKKWEADEKMGENATISPVLYANMIHREELDTNYRDWPARGRAIAKLWRKLPTEQREPYRIKARENRVKLKETKKKKTTTKKSAKEPTTTATNVSQEQPTPQQIHPTTSFASNSNDQPLPTSTSSTNLQFNPQQMMVNPHLTQPQRQQPRPSDDIQSQTITTSSIDLPMPSSTSDASRGLLSPPPPPPPHSAPQQPHTPQHHKTPIGATVLTVPEPQQLSPLLQKISPPYAISSLSNVIRSPTSPFVPGVGGTQSPYPPNTPSTPHTPATPVSDSPSNKSDAAPGSGNKEKKKRPKLTKQEREANKLAREQKKKMAEKKQQEQQQWKILQQQRIFEQERQAILNQSKTMVGVSADPMHPSQRFNATMNSSLAEDALQHSLMLKAKAASNPETIQPSTSLPASTPNSSMDPTPTSGIARPASAFSSGQIATTTTVMSSIPSNGPHRPTTSSLHPNEPYPPQHHGMSRNEFLKGMHGNNLPDTFASYEHLDPMRMRSAEQQKAYLFQQQQQQYMASQQQYIQWQLAQQAAGNAYGQDHAKANATDGKDLTGLESEEQERLIRMMYEQRQNEKRPGDHPPGQPYPPFPPDSRASGHGGYPPSRMGQFPGANSPEAAIYQQMFMEYFMRYRKSQGHLDSSGGQFPPSHEIYLMAELAKQSFIRQQYAAKGYGMGQQQPCHPKPQEPFKHSTGYRGGVPPEQYDWNRMHQGGGPLPHQDAMMPPAHPHGAPTSVVKPPNVPANPLAQKPPPAPSKPSSNMQGTLPKSASFQISRIAADSTSNDDFPNTTDDSAKQNEQDITKKTENKAMTDENEISSSKSSRGFSESTDTEETSTISTKNDEPVDQTKESASSGHAETEADERVTTPTDKKKLSTYEELNDNEDIFPVTRTRFLSRPRRCFDDEEEILGRGCFHSRYSDSDNESFTELPSLVDDDEDRCFLDNQPMCTMGLENDDAPTDSNERLPSASSMDENSNSTTVPSRPESCSDQQFTTQDRIPSSGSMEAPKVPRDPTSHFSPLGNVPDSAYMNNLLSRSASQGMSQHHSSYYQQQSSMFGPPSSMPSYPASSSVHGSPMFINSHNPELPARPGHYSAFPRDQMPIGGRSTAPLSDFLPKQSAINTPMEPWKCVFPLPVSTPNTYPPGSTPQQVTDQKPKVNKKQQKTPEKRPHSRTIDLKTPPAREGTPVQTSANQPPNSSIPTSSPSLLTTAIKSEPSNHNASHSITKTNQSPTAKTLSSAISSTLTATAGLPTSQPSTGSDSKLISVHPGTPQYHQIFVYQHQLLIMQFQQYQFQLQAQFQQLSLQQMSSQQLHVLQQQFQQQMMLLQQQFNQQQAQLHRMAATGIQFTESQLNAMYQQQVITQQAYQQWIHALSPRQRMHLQQQMQARMREVQHQMAQIVHQTSRNEDEATATKPATAKKSKPRRPKKKQAALDPIDMPPPKLPVPEMSPSMKKLQQIGQEPVPPFDPGQEVMGIHQTPPTSTTSVATVVETSSITTPVTSHMVQHSIDEKPPFTHPGAPPTRQPIMSPAAGHMKGPSPIMSPQMKTPHAFNKNQHIPTQIEEIQQSFIRHQQNMRNDSKNKETPKFDVSPITQETKKQMFFPDKVPIHPSQLLRQKSSGQSPTTPNQSPKISKTAKSLQSPTNSIDKLHPFASHPELHQLALDAMQNKTQQQTAATLLSPTSNDKPHINENTSKPPKSAFSVSSLLGSGGATQPQQSTLQQPHADPMFSGDSTVPPTAVGEHPKIPLISAAERKKEAEEKKQILKLKKKEEREKALLEKKNAREQEKQKRIEERAKQKQLREQAKAAKIQEKMLIKQKAAHAKAIAIKTTKKAAQSKLAQQKAETLAAKKPPEPTPPPPVEVPPVTPPPITPKIPLCEPDAKVSTPLVQPIGMLKSTEPIDVVGTFGYGIFEGFDDIYGDKPEPPPVEEKVPDLSNPDTVLLNDIPLFASPERIEDEVMADVAEATQEVVDHQEISLPYELQKVLACNLCYGSLQHTVYYIDRGFEEISEGLFDQNDVINSDQLAFCSSECVDMYQKKVDYVVDDDVALVDAVKAASMFCLDENHNFPPLSSDEVRGNECAPGMEVSKQEPTWRKRWKRWQFPFNADKKTKRKRLEREDLYKLMHKYDVRLKLPDDVKDNRVCMLCNLVGDGETAQASRLLNYDVDQWVHLNCALWSNEVYEALNGGLHKVDIAKKYASQIKCAHCGKFGASITCSHTFGPQQRLHCEKVFHFCCALQAQCKFYKDKTILCPQHKMFGVPSEELRNFTVRRKVYIERDVTKQIAKMLQMNSDLEKKEYTFRVGNLIFQELGHVPLHLLEKFSDTENIYPIGFETISLFWDYENVRQRRYYTCTITDEKETPYFKVKVHSKTGDPKEFSNTAPKGAWEEEILKSIQKERGDGNLLKFFPEFINGQSLFGLVECTIKRMMESLPGIPTIEKYNFRFGRTPILIKELPLALNPSGCIRSERFHKHRIRPLAMRTASDHSLTPTPTAVDSSLNNDSWLSYPQRTAQILGTKTGQYRKMRQDWRNTVILGRSRIQGLGLFVKKDVEENTFMIEYIGSLIRNEVANRLEAHYERHNRGIYMFRIDRDAVVDATMAGGPARYINHSCDPNCVAEIISIEGRKRIIIISSRRIEKGEELTYDYKFDLEDDSMKISCLCGSTNCRKWMN